MTGRRATTDDARLVTEVPKVAGLPTTGTGTTATATSHGTKRRPSLDNLQLDQPLAKRFDLLSLGKLRAQ
jgi:hypothetical protein